MGTANVIPGVSGGTIALITGIFERLINAIKSFNLTAIKLFFSGKFKAFAKHCDLVFLISILTGIAIAIISVAKIFEYFFEYYPIYIWSFFFGLLLTSVPFVCKEVSKWNFVNILMVLIGTAIALIISLLTPASENTNIFYLFLCGVIAACSMILPGLSGSFVLILLGNYQLVMIESISNLTKPSEFLNSLKIIIPVGIGCIVGLLGFSYILSWVFKKFRNPTISILAGFVLGSSLILYPWKNQIFQNFGGKEKLIGYKWYLPEINSEFFISIAIMILGAALIITLELIGNKIKKNQ